MHVPGKFAIASDTTVQFRRASTLKPQFTEAIRNVCESNDTIDSCYLLDVRKPNTEEIALHIAITTSDKSQNLDSIALQFQRVLQDFPEQASKTYICSSAPFLERCEGFEFYKIQA